MAYRDYPEKEDSAYQQKERFTGGLVGELQGARVMSQREAMDLPASAPSSEIDNQIHRIHKMISYQADIINAIGQRIQPVMNTGNSVGIEAQTAKVNCVRAPECMSPLGNTLADIASSLESLTQRAERILNSVML